MSGKEKTKIIELSSRISSFCINESQIFWIQNNQLYSCTHNGNDIKLFSEQPVNGIQAVSNQLYYFDESYEDGLDTVVAEVAPLYAIRLAFQKAREYCEHKGIMIKNATRGGKLEVFERISLDDVINH